MIPREIAKFRIVAQHIASSRCRTPAEVVARLGAMQAQDYAGALWSIGLRLAESTEKQVFQAIETGAIVRTWPMRGTLHFVAAADLRWMLELLTPRIIDGSARRHQQLELDDAVFARCRKLFQRALHGGRHLTRDEMYELLERSRISTAGQRGYHLLWRLAHEGVLCFGPHSGKQATFVLLDEWVPAGKTMKRDDALAELAHRYFTSHGPATVQDFAWWSGLKISDARSGLEMVSGRLTQAIVEGKTYWMSRDLPGPADGAAVLYLLPGFDEYLLGYTDRSASLDRQHSGKVVPGGNGMFLSTIIQEGRVIGTWKRSIKKKAVTVSVSPFMPLTKAKAKAFEAEAKRYADFLRLATG